MLYLIIIAIANVFIIMLNTVLNLPATAADVGMTALSSVLGTVAVIAVDGVFALFIRRFPPLSGLFRPGSRLFRVSGAERRFYRKIKLNAWKDKIPELGNFTDFHKDRFVSASDPQYLGRFLTESHYGVAIHLANAAFGFLILFIPIAGRPSTAIPVMIVNFVLSLLPAMILRFNTPPLLALYKKASAHSAVSNDACEKATKTL